MPKSYYIETYGCSLNISDTEYMEGRLQGADFVRVDTPDDADAIIINTCTVKDRTYRTFVKRLFALEELRRRRADGQSLAIVIAGCIPKANRDDPVLLPYACLGTDAIGEIAEVVEAALRGASPKCIEPELAVPRLNQPKCRRNPVIEILPIAKGCLGECAYCQTRLARGRLESYPVEEILCQAESALRDGVKEIWLTAQDTGAYGLDVGSSLPDLLRALLQLPGDFRIRIGMGNLNFIIRYINQLLELFSDERLFRFLHLPLQSGSDRILRAMNRQYAVGQFLEICEAICEQYADFSVATDVIVGFPGETDEDFERTLEVLERIHPAVVNRSKYSPRPHTPAAHLPQIPSAVISERSRRLTRVVERLSVKHNRRWLGKLCTVLIDDRKKAGSVVSRNASYKPVAIPINGKIKGEASRLRPGNFCAVEITKAETFHLIGQVCNAPIEARKDSYKQEVFCPGGSHFLRIGSHWRNGKKAKNCLTIQGR